MARRVATQLLALALLVAWPATMQVAHSADPQAAAGGMLRAHSRSGRTGSIGAARGLELGPDWDGGATSPGFETERKLLETLMQHLREDIFADADTAPSSGQGRHQSQQRQSRSKQQHGRRRSAAAAGASRRRLLGADQEEPLHDRLGAMFLNERVVRSIPLPYRWHELEHFVEEVISSAIGTEMAYWRLRKPTCADLVTQLDRMYNTSYTDNLRAVLIYNNTWTFLNPATEPFDRKLNQTLAEWRAAPFMAGSTTLPAPHYNWPRLLPMASCGDFCHAQMAANAQNLTAAMAASRAAPSAAAAAPSETAAAATSAGYHPHHLDSNVADEVLGRAGAAAAAETAARNVQMQHHGGGGGGHHRPDGGAAGVPPGGFELPNMILLLNTHDNMFRFGMNSRAPLLSYMKWWTLPWGPGNDTATSLGRVNGQLHQMHRNLTTGGGIGPGAVGSASAGDLAAHQQRRLERLVLMLGRGATPADLPAGVNVSLPETELSPYGLLPQYDMDLLLPHLAWVPSQLSTFPWKMKKDVAFFSGMAYCTRYPDTHMCQYCLRGFMAYLSSKHPDKLQVELTSELRQKVGPSPYDMELHYNTSAPTSLPDHSRHRFLLHLDGFGGSTRMAHLLATDSIILKSRSPFIEWFSRLLIPGVHYLEMWKDPQDPLDVLKAMDHARNLTATDPVAVRHVLVENMRTAARHLGYASRLLYARSVLQAYRSLYEDMDACVDDLRAHLAVGLGREEAAAAAAAATAAAAAVGSTGA